MYHIILQYNITDYSLFGNHWHRVEKNLASGTGFKPATSSLQVGALPTELLKIVPVTHVISPSYFKTSGFTIQAINLLFINYKFRYSHISFCISLKNSQALAFELNLSMNGFQKGVEDG